MSNSTNLNSIVNGNRYNGANLGNNNINFNSGLNSGSMSNLILAASSLNSNNLIGNYGSYMGYS